MLKIMIGQTNNVSVLV